MTIKSLSSSQIALIMKKGRAYSSGSFLLKTLPETVVLNEKNIESTFLCSFIASKKVFAKAVDRNRAKRRLKESFLEALRNIKEENLIGVPYQFVFLAKKEVLNNDFTNLFHDIKQILLKDYIIKQ